MTKLLIVKERAAIIRQRNPCLTLQEIGTAIGVSRERVRQVLKKKGLATKHALVPKEKYLCMYCGKPSVKPTCWDCYKQHSYVEIACDNCGQLTRCLASHEIWVRQHGLKQHHFCSQHCKGQYAGTHYGWAVHQYWFKHRQKRKWDYDEVWAKHLETGYGATRLSRLMHIPESTVNWILRAMKVKTNY